MNPFFRYLADKKSAHRQTDTHTPMTTRPCGLRRAGNNQISIAPCASYRGAAISPVTSLVCVSYELFVVLRNVEMPRANTDSMLWIGLYRVGLHFI